MGQRGLRNPGLVVGLGATAGLESVRAFLHKLEGGHDLAYLLGLPEPEAAMQGLMEHCPLALALAQEGDLVEKDRLYLLPPGAGVTRSRGRLRVTSLKEAAGSPIDGLLSSLAEAAGTSAVGVVLSGRGTDGALGLKAIHKAGGWTLMARPEGGDQPAILGVVDKLLEPEQIPAELMSYAIHLSGSSTESIEEQVLDEICACLQHSTGHSFKDYKRSTVSRRVLRRMRVLRIPDPPEYLRRLRKDSSEAEELFRELLIGVTSFFRNPQAFQTLDKKVLTELVKGAGPEGLRVWVPGAASGEEAYSLGMLLLERCGERSGPPPLQLFVTDIDQRALATARAGAYPSSIAEEVSPERLKRFFSRRGKKYVVNRELREISLISHHDLTADPPFSRLDLISCRNLLIYLGPQLQKRLFRIFHYALRPGGYLFLGSAESVGVHEEFFRTVDARARIYQRKPASVSPQIGFSAGYQPRLAAGTSRPADDPQTVTAAARALLLEHFSPPYAVVDEDRRLHSLSEGVTSFLTLSEGQFYNDIVRLCPSGMRVALRAALTEAIRDETRVTRENLRIGRGRSARAVKVTVCPLKACPDESRLFMVVFEEQPMLGYPAPRLEDSDQLIEHLERELQDTRQDLERTIQELEATNEELKSSNEELLSINEELHSANEELETSKEELQARTESLSRANSDIQNLLSSTQIATIFLDEGLNIRGFTPAACEIYNLLPSDMGRPLSHITSRAEDMPPLPEATELGGGGLFESEVRLQEGRIFLRRLTPYRVGDGRTEGLVVTFIDVTALRESERQARERTSEIEAVYRTAPVGLALIDRDFRYVRVNEILARVHGLPVEEHLGRSLKEVLGDLADQMKPSLAEVMETGKSIYGLEYRAPTPAHPDVLRDWWISYFPMHDREGRVTAVNAVMQETTERKWEERRRQAEHATGRVLNQGGSVREVLDGVMAALTTHLHMALAEHWRLEEDQLVLNGVAGTLDASQLEAWVGLSRDYAFPRGVGLPGRVWAEGDLVWTRELQVNREFRRRQEVGSLALSVGVGLPLLSGEEFHGVLTLYSEGGLEPGEALEESLRTIGYEVARYLGRKRAEEALAVSEERLHLAQEAGQMGTWDWDLASDTIYLNPRARRLLALGAGESPIPAEEAFARVHPEDLPQVRQSLRETVEQGRELAIEFRVRGAGEERWLVGRGVALQDREGRPERIVGLNFDVTERRRQEEALRRTAREKDEFLAMLAHELRNPLAPVGHAVRILRAYPPAEPEVAEMYDIIERQSCYLARLMDDMLDVSRITRGKIPLVRRPEDLVQLIRSAALDYRSSFEQHDLELRLELPQGPLWAHVDAVRIGQVVGNLLQNAAKFTDPGGQVTVALRAAPEEAVLVVKDTGVGLEPGALEHLFEPFQQAAQSLDRQRGGLGLGLALVRGLVELHGGRITANSEGKGRGAEFTIRLPLTEVPSQAPPPKKDSTVGVRVLLIEDNPMVARTTARLLELSGHEVAIAHDGPAGIELAAQWQPDLILCDIGLPGMDGFAIAEALRRQEPKARLVALSGYSDQEKKERATASGFDHYLIKPLSLEHLTPILSGLAELDRGQ